MVWLYQAAEFSIYPSKFDEPFGLATIESMACGKPIVVSNILRDGLGLNGRKKVKEKFTKEIMSAKTYQVYAGLLQ